MSRDDSDCLAPPIAAVCSTGLPGAPLDCRAFRSALGRFATGVTVITSCNPTGEPFGLTVNSFAAVSLDPPLVLWSLSNHSQYLPAFRQAGHFSVNVLAAGQEELLQRFASREQDRWEDVDWQPGLHGAPLIDRCCAVFEASIETIYPGGDHRIIVGRVARYAEWPDRAPLVFQGGRVISLAA